MIHTPPSPLRSSPLPYSFFFLSLGFPASSSVISIERSVVCIYRALRPSSFILICYLVPSRPSVSIYLSSRLSLFIFAWSAVYPVFFCLLLYNSASRVIYTIFLGLSSRLVSSLVLVPVRVVHSISTRTSRRPVHEVYKYAMLSVSDSRHDEKQVVYLFHYIRLLRVYDSIACTLLIEL